MVAPICVPVVVLALGLIACGEPVAATPEARPPVAPAPADVAEPEVPCRAASPEERAAIALAEAFVRENGYTDAAVPDDFVLTPESLEHTGRDEVLAQRHGSLEPAAFGVFPHDGPNVSVIFRYTLACLERVYPPAEAAASQRDHGRAVEVAGGAVGRIVHASARLESAEPICAY